jgi:hypothetical protein
MDRIIVVTGFAPIPVEGPFAETPVCILPSLEPEYAEDDGLPPGFAGRPFSPDDCRLSMDSDEVVAWQYTAQWRDATPGHRGHDRRGGRAPIRPSATRTAARARPQARARLRRRGWDRPVASATQPLLLGVWRAGLGNSLGEVRLRPAGPRLGVRQRRRAGGGVGRWLSWSGCRRRPPRSTIWPLSTGIWPPLTPGPVPLKSPKSGRHVERSTGHVG